MEFVNIRKEVKYEASQWLDVFVAFFIFVLLFFVKIENCVGLKRKMLCNCLIINIKKFIIYNIYLIYLDDVEI